jgi:hypothetical protein
MDSTSPAIHVSGHCYCGGITYEVSIPEGEEPIFTAYCHCDSCRRAHSAPLYHVVCVEESMLRLTAGAELLTVFHKPGASLSRAFCSSCGSKMMNRFPGWRPGGRIPVAFFPNTLEEPVQQALPQSFRPARNNRIQECVLDVEKLRVLLALD